MTHETTTPTRPNPPTLHGVLSRDASHGTVDVRWHYATTPSDLWDALTRPDRLARWLGHVTGDLRPGGQYRIAFEPGDDTQVSAGSIQQCQPPHRLEVTWQSPGEDASSLVVAELSADGLGTQLHLVHSRLPHSSDVGYAAGWEVHLLQLQASLDDQATHDFWSQWETYRDAYRATL